MALLFAVVIFIIMLLTMFIMFIGIVILTHLGFTEPNPIKFPLFMFAIFSIIIGTILALFLSRVPLTPFREISTALDKLAKGDFNTKLNLRGPDEIHELNARFNNMAQELGSIELLRSDFVNNFSHEFKTPIVSIRGFAKILRYQDISKEEHEEYLDIIINESERLADLATNVLNLSKIENQTIASNKTYYNGSEQIRRVIALLESKWSEKNIDINFDCSEIEFYGNAELLIQVWTNLIDNAIKFSPENSSIGINIIRKTDSVIITVSDKGTGISEETQKHLFDKFYQGDTSHITKGNGIGLTLAKKIVELHNGNIFVKNNSIGATFTVELPFE